MCCVDPLNLQALKTRKFDSMGSRQEHQAASQLRGEGSIILDIMRITTPGLSISASPRVEVIAPTRNKPTWLAAPAIPRLYSGRLDGLMRRVMAAYQSGPFRPELRRLIDSIRWLGVFISRWQEASVFATPMLYMAIEAAHGKCVYGHLRGCSKKSSNCCGHLC